MRTIDKAPSGRNTAWGRVLSRLRLFWRLGWMTLDYFLVGGRVRRAYRQRVRHGETLYLDSWPHLPDRQHSKPEDPS